MRSFLFFIVFFCAFVPASFAETFLIDTPGMCVKVEKVEDNRVYLKRPAAPCPVEGSGKASVEMEEGTKEIDVYLDGRHWRKFPVSPSLSPGDVSSAIETAKKQANELSLSENPHKGQALKDAQDITRFFQSAEFQQKLDSVKKLYRDMKGEEAEAKPQHAAKTATNAQRLSSGERLYLFVSSSVPVETLRNYVRAISDLADPNIRIVLRGFVNGASRVTPTISFLQKVLLVEPDCNQQGGRCRSYNAPVIIDPLLFRRYGIERVPAFIYIPSMSVKDGEMSEGMEGNTRASGPYVLHGDISLDAAVRLFAREKKSAGLEGLLKASGE
ncbi:MAG: type-F conjugative transfer system pilin assembly protein TrbC [Syntrophorhabdales bacterium]